GNPPSARQPDRLLAPATAWLLPGQRMLAVRLSQHPSSAQRRVTPLWVDAPCPIASPSPGRAEQRDPSFGSWALRSRCGCQARIASPSAHPGTSSSSPGFEEAQRAAHALAERLGEGRAAPRISRPPDGDAPQPHGRVEPLHAPPPRRRVARPPPDARPPPERGARCAQVRQPLDSGSAPSLLAYSARPRVEPCDGEKARPSAAVAPRTAG